MRTALFVVVAALFAAAPAEAGRKAGVSLPDQMQIGDRMVYLNGLGLREATFLKIDVYVAGLYLERVSSDPAQIIGSNQVKRLVLHFVRHVGHGDIVDAWNKGFKGNAVVPLSKIQPQIASLNAWMPSFSKGDTLTFTFLPGRGVIVEVNGARKGFLPGDDFSRSLLAIWLGPKPPSGDLKRGLLGKHPVTR